METSSRLTQPFYFSLFFFFFFFFLFFLLINSRREEIRRTLRGIPAGRLFRFIREFSSRRYFPLVHVPIPIGGVVNTVWPGIYPCYLIVSFHSNASSYTTGLYTVVISNSHPLFPRSLYRGFAPNDTNVDRVLQEFRLTPLFVIPWQHFVPENCSRIISPSPKFCINLPNGIARQF